MTAGTDDGLVRDRRGASGAGPGGERPSASERRRPGRAPARLASSSASSAAASARCASSVARPTDTVTAAHGAGRPLAGHRGVHRARRSRRPPRCSTARDQQDELVAAVADDGVVGAGEVLQDRRDPDSTPSPTSWPKVSLTALKWSTSTKTTHSSPSATPQPPVEQAPVAQPGERVHQRGLAEPVGFLGQRPQAHPVAQRDEPALPLTPEPLGGLPGQRLPARRRPGAGRTRARRRSPAGPAR